MNDNADWVREKIIDVLNIHWLDLTPQQRYIIEESLEWLHDITKEGIDKTSYDKGYDDGYKEAKEEYEGSGYDNGFDKGFEEGKQKGFEDGLNEGKEIGFNEGYDAGYQAWEQ